MGGERDGGVDKKKERYINERQTNESIIEFVCEQMKSDEERWQRVSNDLKVF